MKHISIPAGRQAGTIQLEAKRQPEEALLIELGPKAKAVVIEGCTAPEGAAGKRRSTVDARLGPGAELSLITLQAWPATVDSERLVRADGGRIVDVSLGSRRSERRFELGPRCRLLAAAVAGPGQSQRLEVSGGQARLLGVGDVEGAGVELFRPTNEQLGFLRARGLPEPEARRLMLSGFLEPVFRELPVEFAVELERLLELAG